MISSNLIGRLGNSMFQIAASIGYARKYGYKWAVQKVPHNNESAIHRVYPNLPKTSERGKTFQEHPGRVCREHGTHYDLCHYDYHDIPNMGDNIFFSGFWQSYKYFEHCKEEVKEVFKLPHVEGYEDYVSIHVRRGDYVQHAGSFPPITDDYLYKAISYIRCDRLSKGFDQKFIFFSDDIQWCKDFVRNANFRHENEQGSIPINFKFEFSEGRDELQDLSLMASCGHHIMANSSFSWWGAYLTHNPQSVVVCPSAKTWFGETAGVKRPVVDLILPNWIQFDTR